MAVGSRGGARPSFYLAGELIRPAILVDMPARKTKVAVPVVKVGGEEYEILAEGMLAERFAGLRLGTPVMVAGDLVVKHWKTAGGVEHQKLELVATRMVP